MEEVEEGEEPREQPAFEFDVFKNLKHNNGKTGGQILFALFQGVFDDNIEQVNEHLITFIEQVSPKAELKGVDFSDSISKLIQNFGELCLDVPLIHKYTF